MKVEVETLVFCLITKLGISGSNNVNDMNIFGFSHQIMQLLF